MDLRPDSRAVLIAVSSYDDARLPSIGAAGTSVEALRGLLSDPRLGLWQPGQVTVIRDPGSVSDLTGRIAELAVSATGSMLLCYVGRGALSASGRLYLAVRSTRLDRLESTAVAWDSLARLLRSCPAQVRRVILDCPVTGMPPAGQSLVALTRLDGVYTLTATDLIGELVDLIHLGIPTKPVWLALTDIYPSLCERQLARDRPIPEHGGTDGDPGSHSSPTPPSAMRSGPRFCRGTPLAPPIRSSARPTGRTRWPISPRRWPPSTPSTPNTSPMHFPATPRNRRPWPAWHGHWPTARPTTPPHYWTMPIGWPVRSTMTVPRPCPRLCGDWPAPTWIGPSGWPVRSPTSTGVPWHSRASCERWS